VGYNVVRGDVPFYTIFLYPQITQLKKKNTNIKFTRETKYTAQFKTNKQTTNLFTTNQLRVFYYYYYYYLWSFSANYLPFFRARSTYNHTDH